MPFAVSQWPHSPDPRLLDFAITGYDFGQVPPWRWLMTTSGAIFPYESLNDGIIWQAASHSINNCEYNVIDLSPDLSDDRLAFFGSRFPIGGAPGSTIRIFCTFFQTAADPATNGSLFLTYPKAIGTRSFVMSNDVGGEPFLPNPVLLTPRKWNAE